MRRSPDAVIPSGTGAITFYQRANIYVTKRGTRDAVLPRNLSLLEIIGSRRRLPRASRDFALRNSARRRRAALPRDWKEERAGRDSSMSGVLL